MYLRGMYSLFSGKADCLIFKTMKFITTTRELHLALYKAGIFCMVMKYRGRYCIKFPDKLIWTNMRRLSDCSIDYWIELASNEL